MKPEKNRDGKKSRRAGIEDVAKAAGVSRGTVSRAFNQRSDINRETRERVLNISRRLGYFPNSSARGLAKGRSETIGVVCPNLSNPFFTEMVTHIERASRETGISAILAMTHNEIKLERDILERMCAGRVDGVVITPCESDESVSLLNSASDRVPLVSLKRLDGLRCDTVMFDDARAAGMVVEHLVGFGHERIAFLAPPEPSWSVAQRETAYRDKLRRLDLDYAVTLECLPSPRAGEDDFNALFRELSKPAGEAPTAVFAFDDIIALNLIKRLLENGFRVPEDVSVVGMDDISISELAVVPLTTVAFDSPTLGEVAVETLMERLAGKLRGDPRDVRLEPRFVERSSTAKVAAV